MGRKEIQGFRVHSFEAGRHMARFRLLSFGLRAEAFSDCAWHA